MSDLGSDENTQTISVRSHDWLEASKDTGTLDAPSPSSPCFAKPARRRMYVRLVLPQESLGFGGAWTIGPGLCSGLGGDFRERGRAKHQVE